jgi:hypothetical protein
MLSHVSVEITPKLVQLNAGDSATVNITVVNTGPLVDAFQVSVDGLERSWYQLTAAAMRLDPGARAVSTLAIKPPRACATTAKGYPLVVRVASNRNAGQDQLVPVEMTVLPFYDFAMTLRPQKRSGARGAYQLNLHNQGNAPLNIDLKGNDPEELCRFQFDPQRPNLPPCEQRDVKLTVVPGRRPLLGRPKAYRFTLTGTPDPGTAGPKAVQGELDATSRIPGFIKAVFSFPVHAVSRMLSKGKRALMIAAAVVVLVVIVAVVVVRFLLPGGGPEAEIFLNPGQNAVFGFQLPEDDPTHLKATAQWEGTAEALELVLQQPDGKQYPPLRVSPSAPSVTFTLDQAAVRLGAPGPWRITVKNISGTGQAEGNLSLEFTSRE